jgi:hypothetical protein
VLILAVCSSSVHHLLENYGSPIVSVLGTVSFLWHSDPSSLASLSISVEMGAWPYVEVSVPGPRIPRPSTFNKRVIRTEERVRQYVKRRRCTMQLFTLGYNTSSCAERRVYRSERSCLFRLWGL